MSLTYLQAEEEAMGTIDRESEAEDEDGTAWLIDVDRHQGEDP
jgi:hypothetical protein